MQHYKESELQRNIIRSQTPMQHYKESELQRNIIRSQTPIAGM